MAIEFFLSRTSKDAALIVPECNVIQRSVGLGIGDQFPGEGASLGGNGNFIVCDGRDGYKARIGNCFGDDFV
jgi:hypothetical protein